ncbi:MAG: phosphatase PAP2 family protein [Dehalococcoidia bacterium]|nr:phosphatase PAP2 family protein [Dehalococcoidia bacterium]
MAAVLFAGTWRIHPALSLVGPLVALAAWWPTVRSSRPERWLFFYVAGVYVYTVLRAYADEFAPWQSTYVIQFDEALFGGTLPSVQLQRALFRPWALGWVDMLAAMVHASFFIAPQIALVVVWRRWPSALRPHVLSALMTFFIGLALFFLVPTVPPWLASYQGEVRGVYRIISFVFNDLDQATYQTMYAALGEPNSVAAVPSIHMAITCVVLFRVQALAPRWTWAVALYTALMAVSLVYLGEHYVFDVMMGVLIAGISEFVVRRMEARRQRPASAPALVASR